MKNFKKRKEENNEISVFGWSVFGYIAADFESACSFESAKAETYNIHG